jgi:hypothetical protein
VTSAVFCPGRNVTDFNKPPGQKIGGVPTIARVEMGAAVALACLQDAAVPNTFLNPGKLDLLPAVQQRSRIALQRSGYLEPIEVRK